MSTQPWTQQHHNKTQNKLFTEKAKTAEKQQKKEGLTFSKILSKVGAALLRV